MEDSKRTKIICVVGPTASGKTDLAFRLAQDSFRELVNADSKQVYKGIDILPGKDVPTSSFTVSSLSDNTPYTIGYYMSDSTRLWLLDVVSPYEEFSVYDFVNVARPVIEDITKRNHTPIVVGGSGFYIKALLDGVETLSIPQNTSLRAQLEEIPLTDIQNRLKKIDSDKFNRMNHSDSNNKRRLIRAIEIAEHVKEFGHQDSKHHGYNARIIGLKVEREELKKRIDSRIQKRISQGVIDEIRVLFDKNEALSGTCMGMNGIEPLFAYFEGEISKDDAILQWKQSEYLNAKKQHTWFGNDSRIEWYDTSDPEYELKVLASINSWLESN